MNPSGIFRLGESPLWASSIFEKGETIKEKELDFSARDDVASSKDIRAVTWEVYTKNKDDLLDALWKGELTWDWMGTRTPIGPLSMFHGSFFDMFFSQGRESELEQLADLKSQQEWRDLCQTFLMGQGYFFRGLLRYEQIPITLPSHTTWGLRVVFNEAFTPREEVRLRVILNGVWKKAIPAG